MGDSDDDCDTWRSRDKYPKEREISPQESRNEKRNFNSYQSPVKSSEPPFKRFRREYNDDSNNYNQNNKRNFGDDSNRQSSKPSEDGPNYPTQPMLLQFKSFLQQQDDDIEMEEAMKKYNLYKENFVKKQLKTFFESHNSQEWFKEKYMPNVMEKRRENLISNIVKRKEIFEYLEEKKWFNIKLHYDNNEEIVRLMDAIVILLEGGDENDLKILDSRRYRSESPNEPRSEVVEKKEEHENSESENIETKVDGDDITDKCDKVKDVETVETSVDNKMDTEGDVIQDEVKKVEEKKDKSKDPRPLHKTYSIFLRNLHPNVLRSEIEALVKPYDGFLRLALQDPTPDRKFFRRGWVTFDCSVNIKEICWNLNNIRLHECDIGAIVNRELTQRVRPASFLSSHNPVMKQDIKIAAKLVAKFDKRYGLWQKESGINTNPLGSENPLLRDITEFLVDEGSYEEEALLGGNLNNNLELTSMGDPANIVLDCDEKLAKVLDRLILYLRFVHSFDYYSTTEYQMEDEMPHRCGIIHARGNNATPDKPISQKDVEEYIKNIDLKAQQLLNAADRLTIEEAKALGYKEQDEVVEEFMKENSQMLAEDKWLCPLSGKKFKGPEFVKKHILNKHSDRIDEVRLNAEFFNNYLLDNKRPQLPEHPGSKAGFTKNNSDGSMREEGQTDLGYRGQDGNRGGSNRNYESRGGMGGYRNNRNEDYERRNNYRGDRNSPGGGGGYRNNYDGGRGGGNFRKNYRGGGRQRNGGGSYYSRKMMSYNDLDAPNDD